MQATIKIVAFGCAGIVWVGAMVAMFVMAYASIRAGLNLADNRRPRWMVRLNRFNAVWYPDQLSPDGLRYYALHRRASRVFFGGIAAFLLLGGIGAMVG